MSRNRYPLLLWLTNSGLLALLVFSACSPTTPPLPVTATNPPALTQTTPPTPTATPRPTLGVDVASLRGINLTVWHAFAGESQVVFSEQTALFNATNAWGITVSEVGYGDHLTLFEAMQAAMPQGGVPQLVVALPEQALAWEAEELVVDMGPYLGDAEYGFTEDELADIPAVFRTLPGLPAQRSARYLFFNQTWAHELGFTAPPQTPEEFRQQACAANAAFRADSDLQNDGYGGWVVDSHWQTGYAWLLAFGGSPIVDDGYVFTSQEIQAAFDFLKSLYDDHCAWLMAGTTPYDAFALRKALFVTGDLADIPNAALAMNLAANPDDWALIPFPGENEPIAVTYGPSYLMLESSPEEQLAAWLFIRWMLSPESQALWTEATGLLPLRMSEVEMITSYRSASPQWENALESLELLEATPRRASWRMVRYLLEDSLNHLFQVNLPRDQILSLLEILQGMAEELDSR